MNEPVLAVDEFSVVYRSSEGDVLAVDQVTAEVGRGEIVGLVGQTGCGKSTLVNAMLGSLPRHQSVMIRGDIRMGGKDVIRSGQRQPLPPTGFVTIVPQNTHESLNPLFRIRTQLIDLVRCASPLRNGWPRWIGGRNFNETISKTLEDVHLPNDRQLLERYPHQLSGGQRQRLLIAMALIPDPQVIIADEPTASLDVTTQMEILRLFRRLASEGKTIFLTTHNLAAAWEICDRIIVMHAGRVVESAERESFFADPVHPYSRSLLAAASNPLERNIMVGSDSEGTPSAGGCHFSESCTLALKVCSQIKPSPRPVRAGHMAACYNPSTSGRSIPIISRDLAKS